MRTDPKRSVIIAASVLLAAAAAASIPVAAQTTEYIVNGDFSQGLNAWVPFIAIPPGQTNSISVVSDAGNPVLQMVVNALEGSGVDWHVQTWQPDNLLDTLASSTTYTLSFRAKASVPHPMRLDLYQWEYDPPVPYLYLGLRVVPTLGTSWKTYTINFRTPDAPMPTTSVKFAMSVGQALGTVWVDDISLKPTPLTSYTGSDLQVASFEPSETWLTKSIQNVPDPPDVAPGDTTHVHEGTTALKLAAGPSGAGYAERQTRLDLSLDNWEMSFWAYVDNPANVANVTVALYSGTETTPAWRFWSQTGLAAGWNLVVVPKTQFYGLFWVNQLAWNGILNVGFKLDTNDNGPANVWIDDLRVQPAGLDRKPPALSMVNLDALSSASVTVAWRTDESATGRLDCGTTTAYGAGVSSGSLTTSHSLTLGGLAPNTLVHCQVASDDSGGRTGRSGDFVFRTDPTTPWITGTGNPFQVGLVGVPGWDDTGTFDLATLHDPFTTRFTHLYGPSMRWETDSQVQQYMDQMQAHGRKSFITIDDAAITSGDLDAIRTRVAAFKDHPALAGWYLYDEPEYHPVTPAQMDAAYGAIKEVDTVHPVTFAAPGFGPNYTFLGALDYGILDPYPIPFAPPDAILSNLAQANLAGKPFELVVQAYQPDLNGYWPGFDPGVSRFPSRDETRDLAYLALNHGARNLQFYGYFEAHVFPGVTAEWIRTNDVANELVRLGPVYASTDAPLVTLQSSNNPNLDVGVKQYQGKAYVTVVNRSASSGGGTLTFTGYAIQSAKEVIGQRVATSTFTTVTDTWSGYGVNIYELALTLQPPTNLAGSALAGRDDRLTWTDASVSETGFEVQRALKSGATCGTYATIGSASASSGSGATVTYDDIGSGGNAPEANKTYCYRVRASNTLVQSTWTGPVQVKTQR